MTERLELRGYGSPEQPALVYLPGLHGDWTLVGAFRRELAGRLRFVEMTYPRTLTWSLDDYASAIEQALARLGVETGWLLGESFGSQIVWSLVARKRFAVQGVILAGGFVRHPMGWGVRFAQRVVSGVPLSLVTRILFAYAKIARARFGRSPEMLAGIREFIARRTEEDRRAATHRLHLIAGSDPRPIAEKIALPVFGISGLLDPIVPWVFVRPWLKRHCPALREYKVVWHADHTVLGTGPRTAADTVVRWVRGEVNQNKVRI
jgi:pimeloyl-ACP methyl ester carboxylesterase